LKWFVSILFDGDRVFSWEDAWDSERGEPHFLRVQGDAGIIRFRRDQDLTRGLRREDRGAYQGNGDYCCYEEYYCSLVHDSKATHHLITLPPGTSRTRYVHHCLSVPHLKTGTWGYTRKSPVIQILKSYPVVVGGPGDHGLLSIVVLTHFGRLDRENGEKGIIQGKCPGGWPFG
jgi:hypothetical protein